MRLLEILLSASLMGLTINAWADPTITVKIDAPIKADDVWSVKVLGEPRTSDRNVGGCDIVEGGGVECKTLLADSRLGNYRITDIIYCYGSNDEGTCFDPANYHHCQITDSTTKPVNDVDAQVVAILTPTQCVANITGKDSINPA